MIYNVVQVEVGLPTTMTREWTMLMVTRIKWIRTGKVFLLLLKLIFSCQGYLYLYALVFGQDVYSNQ